MQEIICAGCSEITRNHDIVNYSSEDGGSQLLCSRCFNAEVAKLSGLESFDNIRIQPIGITDCAGETHQFHFTQRLLGNMVALDAVELREESPDGYRFQMIGDPEGDSFALLGRLVEKIRRTLSVKHITDDDRYGLQIADKMVRGRIEGDYSGAEHAPVVVVDGREISWDDFGRLLMTFEGWQFKLEIRDISEDL
ncbi:MAG: hypothetical protein KJ958_00545 [Gammaproteobacteria bacterium]|nr:hypothetical protein [Gammaproteobacteria bacterium]MBU1977634.1 hypothetical protein [Gammaproteobacteria bacterium]